MNNTPSSCIPICTLVTNGSQNRKSFPREQQWYWWFVAQIRLCSYPWLETTVLGLCIILSAIFPSIFERNNQQILYFSLLFYLNLYEATIQPAQEQDFTVHLPLSLSHWEKCFPTPWTWTVQTILSSSVFLDLQHEWQIHPNRVSWQALLAGYVQYT